jgi:hypothetical protein
MVFLALRLNIQIIIKIINEGGDIWPDISCDLSRISGALPKIQT